MSNKISNKIDCCGSDFETDEVSKIGLFTLSIPLIFILWILILFSFLLSFIKPIRKLKKNLRIIYKANISLIEKQSLLPRLRCDLTALLAKISNSLAQFVYNKFNQIALMGVWVLLIVGVRIVL